MAPIPGDSSKHQLGTSMPQGGHPPHHSITSSARDRKDSGIVRPSERCRRADPGSRPCRCQPGLPPPERRWGLPLSSALRPGRRIRLRRVTEVAAEPNLSARHPRPSGRAAEQRDELAAFPLTKMHPILTGREHAVAPQKPPSMDSTPQRRPPETLGSAFGRGEDIVPAFEAALGWLDGRTIAIEYRWSEGGPEPMTSTFMRAQWPRGG